MIRPGCNQQRQITMAKFSFSRKGYSCWIRQAEHPEVALDAGVLPNCIHNPLEEGQSPRHSKAKAGSTNSLSILSGLSFSFSPLPYSLFFTESSMNQLCSLETVLAFYKMFETSANTSWYSLQFLVPLSGLSQQDRNLLLSLILLPPKRPFQAAYSRLVFVLLLMLNNSPSREEIWSHSQI